MELWTNPECSKSRSAQDILDERKIPYTVRLYLEDPPSRQELEALLETLHAPATAIARGQEGTDDEVLTALVEDPGLIERPIAIHQGRAVVARPPERVLELLSRP
jgi:arsenate reductase